MGPAPRRPGDPTDRDFLSDRRSSGLPFSWRKAIMLSGLAATFVGTLLLQFIGERPFAVKNEAPAPGAVQVLARLSALEVKIDELNLSMTTLALGVQSNGDSIQAVHKKLAAAANDRRLQEERGSSRSAEIITMLTEIRERGGKRR